MIIVLLIVVRVNVTMNGIPVNDAESHQVYWVDLPDLASSVEDIQIQRGIGSSTNGVGSFGGSINILTNKLSMLVENILLIFELKIFK